MLLISVCPQSGPIWQKQTIGLSTVIGETTQSLLTGFSDNLGVRIRKKGALPCWLSVTAKSKQLKTPIGKIGPRLANPDSKEDHPDCSKSRLVHDVKKQYWPRLVQGSQDTLRYSDRSLFRCCFVVYVPAICLPN